MKALVTSLFLLSLGCQSTSSFRTTEKRIDDQLNTTKDDVNRLEKLIDETGDSELSYHAVFVFDDVNTLRMYVREMERECR